MSIFRLYLELGVTHILDFRGYDHILFIMTLCSVYYFNEWKRVLILITAFTVGHTATLVLSTFEMIDLPVGLIEFLIPLTIFITAIFNAVYRQSTAGGKLHMLKYVASLFFGLIHGLGFSGYLKSLLGSEERITTPLFAFNVGIELGQILVVILVMSLSWLITRIFKAPRREWNLLVAGGAMGISLILMFERVPW